jgi:hypothetical protein
MNAFSVLLISPGQTPNETTPYKDVHHSIQSTEWLGGGELIWSTTLSSGVDQLSVKLS